MIHKLTLLRNKSFRLITNILLTTYLISAESVVLAKKINQTQAKPRKVQVNTLGKLKCKNITEAGDFVSTPVNYRPLNRDISVENNQLLRAIGFISHTGLNGKGIYPGSPQEIICNLPGNFKTLNLAFAFNERDVEEKAQLGVVVKFAVYRGGKIGQASEIDPVESAYLRLGDQLRWNIPLQNTGYVKLVVQCLGSSIDTCPPLYFFQDTLR